jgi:predicted O-methyltransferase YrrM
MRIPGTTDALHYIYEHVVKEPKGFGWIRERILATDWPIHIGPEEGRLFQFFIKLGGYKRILEIGTHAGYSTLWMADILPEDGHIWTIEKEKNRLRMARETFSYFPQHASKITLLEGKGMDVLPSIESLEFDFAFIDADKLNYFNYFNWVDQRLRSGGMLVFDNTFLSGAVYGPTDQRISPSALESVQLLNKTLGSSEKYLPLMLPTQEGLTLAIKL